MALLQLLSPAFGDGEPIPRDYGYTERNGNPPLEIGGVPDDADSLALVVDDPDAVEPAGKVWDHWVVWNIDSDRTEIPEDWHPETAIEGQNDYGSTGYGGPNPPDGEHTYVISLYAVDERLDLGAGATKADLEAALEGAVIEKTTLRGTYAPS